MVKVEFYSNPSGGYDWLSGKDWVALKDAGWQRECEDDGWCSNTATILAESVDAAKAQWAAALPHLSPDAEGCECCGNPFWFDVCEED